jgi:hypothetical protein
VLSWFLLALVIFAGGAVIYRLYTTMKQGRVVHGADWDAKQIAELRKRGQDPFQSHDVAFFFALPNENACTALNRQLEAEGFVVDVKAVPDNKEYPYSLYASKNMRVLAPEMSALTRRFNKLAAANQGRYDGWGSN